MLNIDWTSLLLGREVSHVPKTPETPSTIWLRASMLTVLFYFVAFIYLFGSELQTTKIHIDIKVNKQNMDRQKQQTLKKANQLTG